MYYHGLSEWPSTSSVFLDSADFHNVFCLELSGLVVSIYVFDKTEI